MPILTWPSKTPHEPAPASLEVDGIVYPQGAGYGETETPVRPGDNRLILGDNLEIMAALLGKYEGKIDLIYADPPFFTNRRFTARIGRGEDSRKPEGWQLAEGYQDAWPDLEAYLDMLYPRLRLMHRLLSPRGTLYLHLDWHANAYARLLLDEIFGAEQLLNEIVWVYHGPSPIRSAFNRKHDTILVYTKGKEYTFNVDAVRQPYDPSTVKTFASSPKAGFGKVPDLERGKVPEDWWYFPVVARLHSERTGYPTQKPRALLERILLASSNPGDLTADFFCGSGTTPLTAARLGRRFIATDHTWRAVHTARARLCALPAKTPFIIQHTTSHPLPIQKQPEEQPQGLPLRIENGAVRLNLARLPELDYWEIDPRWDGQTFHSAAQAVRPLRKQSISDALPLPEGCEGPVCVRFVDVEGKLYQDVVKA